MSMSEDLAALYSVFIIICGNEAQKALKYLNNSDELRASAEPQFADCVSKSNPQT